MKQREYKLRAALDYAARGWPVLPLHSVNERGACSCGKRDCPSAGKHPRTPHGEKDATTEGTTIREYWRRSPNANIGIATGKRSGIVVIDIDPRNGGNENWTSLCQGRTLPRTARALTGGGGQHVYFTYPSSNVRSGTSKLGPGLDVKSDGGYVVAPPSVHASGAIYRWKKAHDPSTAQLAQCPAWLLNAINDVPAGKARLDSRKDDVIQEGERNNVLTQLAGAMRRKAMSPPAIEAALLAENAVRCSPPLKDEEVKRIAASVGKYKPAPQARGRIVSRRLSTVKAEKVRWLWPDRIPLGKPTVIAGDPGLGKSFLTLDMAARVSSGRRWPDGRPMCYPGNVLILSAEDDASDTIRPRLEKMRANLSRIRVIDGVKLSKPGQAVPFSLKRDIRALKRELERRPRTRLIIIDPISAYLGERVDSHRDADVRALLAPLAKLATEHRVAVVCVSHLNKGSAGKAIYRTSGSLAFVATARTAWLVATDAENPARRLFVPMKNNLAPEGTGLAYRIHGGRLKWEHGEVRYTAEDLLNLYPDGEPAAEREDVKNWLQTALKDGPVPSKIVFAQGKELGFSTSTIKRAKRMLEIQTRRAGGAAEKGHWEWALAPREKG